MHNLTHVGKVGGPAEFNHNVYQKGWERQNYWYRNGNFDYKLVLAKKDDFFLRKYETGDEEAILDLFKQAFAQERTKEHWYWKFWVNPYGQLKIVLAVNEKDELAGHYCGYPVPFYCKGGEPNITYQIGDTMTNQKFRGHGLGKTNILSRMAKYFYHLHCIGKLPFIYGFNTGNIKRFGKRFLGYEYIHKIPYLALDVKNIRFSRWSKLKEFLKGYRVRKMVQTSIEYNDFFENVAHDYGVLIRRDANYLNWRYLQSPDAEYDIFEFRHYGRLQGWAVFVKDKKTLFWGDALFNRKHLMKLRFFLYNIVSKHFPEVQTIEGWFSSNPEWWINHLEYLGFQRLKEPNDLEFAVVRFDQNLSLELFKSEFYYTKGDSDLF